MSNSVEHAPPASDYYQEDDSHKRPREEEGMFDQPDSKRQALESDGQPEDSPTTLHILIPSSMVGAMIGKSGSNIKQMITDSGSRITIAQDPSEGNGLRAPERVVTISGTLSCNSAAQKLVSARVEETQLAVQQQQPGFNPATYKAPHSVLKMLIPAGAMGCIIGKAGSTIKQLSEESGSKISISSLTDTPQSEMWRLVTITGTLDSNNLAQHMVSRKVLEREKTNPTPQPRAAIYRQPPAAAAYPAYPPAFRQPAAVSYPPGYALYRPVGSRY
eukprot:gnl/Spiro4/5236_TR2643_c0_g1_i1.p1 gnl/Spiro4/5236_TR2643_c0_g1~~gnl/Spiro4/5236_TR2643_c0_g1_i1.p1  ORF type:complete len:295 (+),score=50.09 gnl/Spiro4/5236_TR2643_c0_g1_i1:65-886(+)